MTDSPNGPETAAPVKSETAAPAPAQPSGSVISLDDARAEGRAEIGAIIELCALAKRPALVQEYVKSGMSADDVRTDLINKRAAEDDDDTSGEHSDLPGAAAKGGLKANMAKLLSQQGMTALEV